MQRHLLLISLLLTVVLTPVVGADEASHHGHHGHESHSEVDGEPTTASAFPISRTEQITAALAQGGEPIVVDVLGVVCDFCARAMNKTFGKRPEVAAVYVDLDHKTLSLVLQPDANLGDEQIDKFVKRAGYRTAAIRRGEAVLAS
ncbi:MAG: cation transporter, partial [Pseudomonadota bacterium]